MIVNDILDFSKIESGKLTVETSPFDLREALEDSVDLMASVAHSKGLELILLLYSDVPLELYGDSNRIRQVLLNLLGNALKFTERGHVMLEVERLDEGGPLARVRFSVEDTGIGIEPDKLERQVAALEEDARVGVCTCDYLLLDQASGIRHRDGATQARVADDPRISNVQRDMFPAIEAAKRAGVKQVVFLSVIGIERMTFIPHYKMETRLRVQNFQTTFLRCSFFMQNLSSTHRQEIREPSEIFVPVGRAKTSFIDVRDIGAAAARILSEDGQAGKNYDLTGPEALDYWQAAKILSAILGREIKYPNPGAVRFFFETLRRGAPFSYAFVVMGLYTSTRYGMAAAVTDSVERLTGRKPITFKKFTEDYRDVWL